MCGRKTSMRGMRTVPTWSKKHRRPTVSCCPKNVSDIKQSGSKQGCKRTWDSATSSSFTSFHGRCLWAFFLLRVFFSLASIRTSKSAIFLAESGGLKPSKQNFLAYSHQSSSCLKPWPTNGSKEVMRMAFLHARWGLHARIRKSSGSREKAERAMKLT